MNTISLEMSELFLTGLKWAGKGDVMYVCAPIRIQQDLNQNLMTVGVLFAHVARLL